jgi:hypothetical protein
MITGVRGTILAYVAAVNSQSRESDERGIPAVCSSALGEDLLGSAERWKAICVRAANLLERYSGGGKEPEAIQTVEDVEDELTETALEVYSENVRQEAGGCVTSRAVTKEGRGV